MHVRFEYENGKLILKSEKDGVTMIIEFAADAPIKIQKSMSLTF